MTSDQFEEKVRKDISPDIRFEVTPFEDLNRAIYTFKGKDYYVCAIPAQGVKEEVDPSYQSIRGQTFPNREQLEAKIRNFIDQLPSNLDLYE
jgi:hypothetical protein